MSFCSSLITDALPAWVDTQRAGMVLLVKGPSLPMLRRAPPCRLLVFMVAAVPCTAPACCLKGPGCDARGVRVRVEGWGGVGVYRTSHASNHTWVALSPPSSCTPMYRLNPTATAEQHVLPIDSAVCRMPLGCQKSREGGPASTLSPSPISHAVAGDMKGAFSAQKSRVL